MFALRANNFNGFCVSLVLLILFIIGVEPQTVDRVDRLVRISSTSQSKAHTWCGRVHRMNNMYRFVTVAGDQVRLRWQTIITYLTEKSVNIFFSFFSRFTNQIHIRMKTNFIYSSSRTRNRNKSHITFHLRFYWSLSNALHVRRWKTRKNVSLLLIKNACQRFNNGTHLVLIFPKTHNPK